MSEEAPKKRGRPRKTMVEGSKSDAVETIKKTVTKQKPTTGIAATATKTAKRVTKVATIEATEIEAVLPKRTRKINIVQPQPSEPVVVIAPTAGAQEPELEPVEPLSQPQITTAKSNILSQVFELERSRLEAAAVSLPLDSRPMSIHPTASLASPAPSKPKPRPKASKTSAPASKVFPKPPTTAAPSSKSNSSMSAPSSKASVATYPPKSLPASTKSSTTARPGTVDSQPPESAAPFTAAPTSTKTPKPTPSQNPSAVPRPPLTAMNSEIVHNITSRAGARRPPPKPLPPNYKQAARSVTMAIVAAPIAIVTSYFLWDRLVMGHEKKHLVPVVEEPGKGPGKVIAEDPPA